MAEPKENWLFTWSNVPYIGIGLLSTIVGPYVYDNIVGPVLLEQYGLGALVEHGQTYQFATSIGTALSLSMLYMALFDRPK